MSMQRMLAIKSKQIGRYAIDNCHWIISSWLSLKSKLTISKTPAKGRFDVRLTDAESEGNLYNKSRDVSSRHTNRTVRRCCVGCYRHAITFANYGSKASRNEIILLHANWRATCSQRIRDVGTHHSQSGIANSSVQSGGCVRWTAAAECFELRVRANL
jgi:hypothetical protein